VSAWQAADGASVVADGRYALAATSPQDVQVADQ